MCTSTCPTCSIHWAYLPRFLMVASLSFLGSPMRWDKPAAPSRPHHHICHTHTASPRLNSTTESQAPSFPDRFPCYLGLLSPECHINSRLSLSCNIYPCRGAARSPTYSGQVNPALSMYQRLQPLWAGTGLLEKPHASSTTSRC